MSKILLFQQLRSRQWACLWSAYWRLWPVLLRIKFKQFLGGSDWLKKKITLVQNQPDNGASDSNGLSSIAAKQLHESVRLAARLHFMKAECLPKSIVLADMLCASGMVANVVIGVSKQGAVLASHAWVELDGKIVAEPESIQHEFTTLKY